MLGCISIRFLGDGLDAPGRELARLVDEAVALAGVVGPIWVLRGSK